jgi:hypothetical protein
MVAPIAQRTGKAGTSRLLAIYRSCDVPARVQKRAERRSSNAWLGQFVAPLLSAAPDGAARRPCHIRQNLPKGEKTLK